MSYAIAREGALKIKEITYAHAEGFHGGALAHGPYALLEKGTPVILLIIDDEYKDLMNDTFKQLKQMGCKTIVITNNAEILSE